MNPEPFTLAAVQDEFIIDPALTNLDLPQADDDDDNDNDLFLPEGLQEQDEDATVLAIKNSLSRSEAHAAQQQEDRPFSPSAGPSDSRDQTGRSDDNPTRNPVTHVAPYSAPNREESNAPLPQYFAFDNRAEFEVWLAGENSWCHFVQRRTTTPAKRAEERMKARDKAHDTLLQSLPPEEAAAVPDLKKRRRQRTSQVTEKVSFTCHHAGTYESRHIEPVPDKKLRFHTKKTVKCNCPSRMVLSEYMDGSCRVMYHWKHDGHDPYTGVEMNSRLPKILDDWLTAQIESGKGTDAILKLAEITEEGRAEFLLKAETDPSYDINDLPPLIATKAKVKYPDVYNRLRKLRGPIRAGKPKAPRPVKSKTGRKRKATAMEHGGEEDVKDGRIEDGITGEEEGDEYLGAIPNGVDGQFGGEELVGDEVLGLVGEDVRMGEEIARLAGQNGLGHLGGGAGEDGQDEAHEDLARAILRMSPVMAGHEEGEGVELGMELTIGMGMGMEDVAVHLDEAVRRLAEGVEAGSVPGEGVWGGDEVGETKG